MMEDDLQSISFIKLMQFSTVIINYFLIFLAFQVSGESANGGWSKGSGNIREIGRL